MNPGKPPRSSDDLLTELADVIIAAAIAMTGVAGDVDKARAYLKERLAAVCERAGLRCDPPSGLTGNHRDGDWLRVSRWGCHLTTSGP